MKRRALERRNDDYLQRLEIVEDKISRKYFFQKFQGQWVPRHVDHTWQRKEDNAKEIVVKNGKRLCLSRLCSLHSF